MARYQITIHRPSAPEYTVEAQDKEEALDLVAAAITYHAGKNGLPNNIADGRILIQALHMGEFTSTRS